MNILFDTHIHFFDERYKDTSFIKTKERISLANQKGINYFCNVGIDLKTSYKVNETAKKFHSVYAASGFHPTMVNQWNEDSEKELIKLLKEKKNIAIGEIGLDYFHKYTTKEEQKNILKKQLKIAENLNIPVLFHIRDAYDEVIEIVSNFKVNGIVHCFSGELKHAKWFIEKGFLISFSGVLTFKNAKKLQEIAKEIPLEKIVLETDAPYLTPSPFRGKVNQPVYLLETAKKLAELKNKPLEEIIETTTLNALRIFNLEIINFNK